MADNLKTLRKGMLLLDALYSDYVRGRSNGELAAATGLSPSDVTRYGDVLIELGVAERTEDGERLRVSLRQARQAVRLLEDLDAAAERVEAMKQRLMRGQ